MPHRPVSLHAPRGSVAAAEIEAAIDAVLESADDVPVDFPADVLAAAERAVAELADGEDRVDLEHVPFVTLDPASSTDLDQAMHLERTDDGYRVLYAIADVPAFVPLGGRIDEEARTRGATVYLPDRRIPLHPTVISEAAGSLLPDQRTPAFVWTLDLDDRADVRRIQVDRAWVRSREKLAYDAVQEELDAGHGRPVMQLLQEIGHLRTELEADRGGASLNVPEQEIVADEDTVRLQWRRPAPIEDANAQISLMTGMAAASLMLEHGVGILRTMPPADQRAVARFRRQAEVLGVPWENDVPYGAFLRSLDWTQPRHLALLNQAASLFRGTSYAAFTSPDKAPEDPVQAAIAAPYAHTTAPLRRLVDRFVLLVCHAHAHGVPVAPELLAALDEIPDAMRATAARAGDLERRAFQVVETAVLSRRDHETFAGTVIDRREASSTENGDGAPVRVEVQLQDPPVTLWAPGVDAEIGTELAVRLGPVDPSTGRLTAQLADS